MSNPRVVVTGVGAVSPFGAGYSTFGDGLRNGSSGARLITSFPTGGLPTRFAAQVPLDDAELSSLIHDQKIVKTLSRSGKMIVVAAQEALAGAAIDLSSYDPYRVGTCIGTGGTGLWDTEHADKLLEVFLLSVIDKGGLTFTYDDVWGNVHRKIHPLTPLRALPNVPTSQIAIMTNARGHCQTITTACTSSTQAIGEAFRQIQTGVSDIVITGGGDSILNAYGMAAFSMLGVLSRNNDEWQTASRPFDRRRDGFMIGEGAVVLVLETLESCLSRGGHPLAELIGYAATNDAFRITDEPPQAWGSIQAMNLSLQSAGVQPGEIDYISAHGTGTKMNDRTETFAIRSVFGEAAEGIPVSSTKSQVGHLVAGAGAIEFAACLWALEQQTIPATINYVEPDPACDLDYVPNEPRPARLRTILSNSFGFGGQNACLVIRQID